METSREGSGRPKPPTWKRVAIASLAVVGALALLIPSLLAHHVSTGTQVSTIGVMHTRHYGNILVVGAGPLQGFPLYEFSGDTSGRLGCGRSLSSGFDFSSVAAVPLSCTGPMGDLASAEKTDDWPAFTSELAPLANGGANHRLLGRIQRPGIGDQVTYGGHLLYLFDPDSVPFTPQGELYAETEAPMAPWHGFWYLVSAATGNPAPGIVSVEPAKLPNGRKVLGIAVDQNLSPVAEVAYGLSPASPATAKCDQSCATTWVPVLTSGPPRVKAGIPLHRTGTVRLGDGLLQVTFDGRRLYLYSREGFFLAGHGKLRASGTAGNGAKLADPLGQFNVAGLQS
jgi:hypothetical protein